MAERIQETRVRKEKKYKGPFKPPEDKFADILTINEDVHNGREWLKKLHEDGQNIYSSFKIHYTYPGMKIYLYNTSEKGIVADSNVGSAEDLERLLEEEEGFEDVNFETGTPLINFRTIEEPITKDELIEFGIFKRVPMILKYLSKTDYETIELLFEN